MSKKEKLLELVMIVKNSGEVLRKCLINNRQYIDNWTILDTGSVDNTCDIIKEELKDNIDTCGNRLNLINMNETQFNIKINEIYNKRKTVVV